LPALNIDLSAMSYSGQADNIFQIRDYEGPTFEAETQSEFQQGYRW
jgi:hypothetical protein